jgi:hypothetical protein
LSWNRATEVSRMGWLIANAGAVQAIAAIVLVAVTIVYVRVTSRSADKAAESARASNDLVHESRLAPVTQLEPLIVPVEVMCAEGHPRLPAGQCDAHGQPAAAERFLTTLRNVGAGAGYGIRIGYCLGTEAR